METFMKMNCADYILEPQHQIKTGENGHEEYSWSKMTEELIVQLHFQLVREKNEDKLKEIENIQRRILKQLISDVEVGEITIYRFQELLTMNYKLVAHTRDIYCGKGEQLLSFLLVLTWYNFYPSLAKKMLTYFVKSSEERKPFGSWKDVKYFCNYCLSQGLSKEHPLIKHLLDFTVEQLENDMILLKNSRESPQNSTKISLVSKWVPREKSKFGWIFHELSFLYFNNYLETPKDYEGTERAISKCNTDFRKLIVYLNKKLDTVQIKQCAKQWKDIDLSRLTSKTMLAQSRALFNLNQHGTPRTIYNDRIECANQFKEYVKNELEYNNDNNEYNNEYNKKTIKMLPGDYVKKALALLKKTSNAKQYEIDLLNLQWKKYIQSQNYDDSQRENSIVLPIVDVSTNMNDELLCHTIGLACFIADKSVKRVMTFSGFSKWHNLEECGNFMDKIRKIYESISTEQLYLNSNLHDALDKIVDTIIEKKIDSELIQNMTLVIFSDMQIDGCDFTGTIYSAIEDKFSSAGKSVSGKAYKPPHVLFWNVKNTCGFPITPMQYNTCMLSGYNPNILNKYFKKTSAESNDTCNSWFLLKKQMNQLRYEFLEKDIQNEIYCV